MGMQCKECKKTFRYKRELLGHYMGAGHNGYCPYRKGRTVTKYADRPINLRSAISQIKTGLDNLQTIFGDK